MICFILLILLIFAGSWYAYAVAFYSPKHKRTSLDAPLVGDQYEAVADNISRISGIMQRISFEEVQIKADDGITLSGRYYHLNDHAPIEILFHGYRSHPYRDCSGGHALARKMGFNTLVVDQRSHGRSEGHTITFGIKERLDCLAWVNYLNKRFGTDTPIILSGLSMGAATVLMAAELELPDNVACIMADSPYSSPVAIIKKVCKDEGYPVVLCTPFLYLGACIFGNFRLGVCTANDAVRNANVPILLIHGDDDRFVPYAMSCHIHASAPEIIDFHTISGAGHALNFASAPAEYHRIVKEFTDNVL